MKFNLNKLLDFGRLLKELNVGLSKLDLVDNFESREKNAIIPALTEVKIQHGLAFIPSRYIFTETIGNGLVSKGTTTWDSNYTYLYNNGPDEVSIKVIFFK